MAPFEIIIGDKRNTLELRLPNNPRFINLIVCLFMLLPTVLFLFSKSYVTGNHPLRFSFILKNKPSLLFAVFLILVSPL